MYAQEILHATNGQAEYEHINEEMPFVRVDMAGMGTKRVRITNLPPETKEGIVQPSHNMVTLETFRTRNGPRHPLRSGQ